MRIISLVLGFKILFGFKHGLIPSFLYLFNVKTDTVKLLLNPEEVSEKE